MKAQTGDGPSENPMNDLATARGRFLDKVNSYAPGEAVRFTGPLDELIGWSEANELVFTPSSVHEPIRFALPDTRLVFWSASPRTSDGAKFAVLGDPRYPAALRTTARDELARIDGKAALPEAIPAMPFTKLIWEPYRTRVLALMTELLAGVKRAESPSASFLLT